MSLSQPATAVGAIELTRATANGIPSWFTKTIGSGLYMFSQIFLCFAALL